jgi:inhibitor of cysteine peptidase
MKSFVLPIVIICSCIGLAMAQGHLKEGVSSLDKNDQREREHSDPSKPIEVKIGQEFLITLDSNMTTGYQWQLVKPPDIGIVELLNNEYRAPRNKIIGAGGQEIWSFKAVAPGKTIISMKYVRPWEKDVPPVKNVQFQIIVSP